MIHVVLAENRHLYARQLAEMRQPGGWTEPGAAWLMALGPEEELQGHLRLSPLDPAAWEASAIWVDGACGASHAGLHRLLAAAAERVLAEGGGRLETCIEARDYAAYADSPLPFRISGPPVLSDDGAKLTLACDLTQQALESLCESLGEARPQTFVVDDEDLAIHGGLGRLQREVDVARNIDAAQVRIDQAAPGRAAARIEACYARLDLAVAGRGR